MSNPPPTDPLVFNGVDGASGGYLTPPLTSHDLASLAQGKPLTQLEAPVAAGPADELETRHLSDLEWLHRRSTERNFSALERMVEGVDPKDLAESGWGVVFAHDANPAIREALAPLLVHRGTQAAASSEQRYRELLGPDGVRPADTKSAFLARHGAGPGPVDPDKLPYYLLLVGSPEAIPYRFQYHLDVQHAIGRLHFVDEKGADDLDAYANYARSVVAAETQAPAPRRATFVGVQNPDDKATTLSAAELVQPLAEKIAADQPAWQ